MFYALCELLAESDRTKRVVVVVVVVVVLGTPQNFSSDFSILALKKNGGFRHHIGIKQIENSKTGQQK